MTQKNALSRRQFRQSGFDETDYAFNTQPGTFTATIDCKRWGKGKKLVTYGRNNRRQGRYEQVGGDAIDFARRFYGMTYPEAVQLMLSMGVEPIREPVEPFARKPLVIPPKYDNMSRVYGYLLRRRGIDKAVLDAFVYRGLIYESADYHNAVFVGMDRDGNIRHIHKRSTAAQGSYRGNAPGSEPEYSFHWHGGGDTLYLFEAPIDLLSYITLHPRCWKSQSYAAACGVSDKVLWQMLQDYPHIQRVRIGFDNDEPGQQAAKRIAKELTQQNIQNELLIPEKKDWNEVLSYRREVEK